MFASSSLVNYKMKISFIEHLFSKELKNNIVSSLISLEMVLTVIVVGIEGDAQEQFSL